MRFTDALWLSATPGEVLLAGPGGGAQDVVVLAALEGDLVADLMNYGDMVRHSFGAISCWFVCLFHNMHRARAVVAWTKIASTTLNQHPRTYLIAPSALEKSEARQL